MFRVTPNVVCCVGGAGARCGVGRERRAVLHHEPRSPFTPADQHESKALCSYRRRLILFVLFSGLTVMKKVASMYPYESSDGHNNLKSEVGPCDSVRMQTVSLIPLLLSFFLPSLVATDRPFPLASPLLLLSLPASLCLRARDIVCLSFSLSVCRRSAFGSR